VIRIEKGEEKKVGEFVQKDDQLSSLSFRK